MSHRRVPPGVIRHATSLPPCCGISDRQARRIEQGKVGNARLREHAQDDPR